MLILLPPSEGKTPARRGRGLDLGSLSFPSLTAMRERVIDTLAEVSTRPDATTVLGVSAGLAEQVQRNLVLRTAPTAQAVRIYTGVLYQALDHGTLDAAAKRRANRTVVILSAAFGALRLTDRVPAYRVDICARVPGIGALDQQWRPALAEALDAAVGPRELIVDCRSTTYAAMWRPQDVRAERWVRVTVPGASHHAKHTRGLVARELSRAEAPRTPTGLAERLSSAFDVDLSPPERPGKPWTLAVQESHPAQEALAAQTTLAVADQGR